MAEVRLTAIGSVTDYDVAVGLFEQVAAIAASIEGALIWEAFADPETALFVVNETFASEDAFLRYEAAVRSSGLWAAVGGTLEFERLVFFTPLEDDATNQSLDAIGRITARRVASL